jgi:hypothetical protein
VWLPLFGQAPLIEHEDRVGIGNGREAVGDRQRGAVCRYGVQRGQNVLFGAGVERAGRFVEQQDRRVLDQRAGNSDALLLAARQLQAAFAHFGVEALRQALDQFCISEAPRAAASTSACPAPSRP